MTGATRARLSRGAAGLAFFAALGLGLWLWSRYGLAVVLTGGLSLCF